MTVTRKDQFHLPDGVIYMDGNSLGPLVRGVAPRVAQVVTDEWGGQLIRGWNDCGWMDQPARVGDRVARLIGAAPGSVTMGDTLSIKVFQALAAALAMTPDRRVILSDTGNFPSDLYMAQGLIALKNAGYELRTVAPEQVVDAIDAATACVLLTEVDYRTGRRHDMAQITQTAHGAGAIMVWDLAHSAGAVDVDVATCQCEFAVGCTYKYLNGGPGAPAFIYVRPDLVGQVEPALAGWLGHDAPFAFDPDYRPAPGVGRLRVGTPPVLQMAALEAALDVWDDVDMADIRAASLQLSDRFITGVTARCPDLQVITPRDPAQRGSQVSFVYDQGYAAMQAVIDRGVIGDFRAPNVMRFGITPLYLDHTDIDTAADVIANVITQRLWDNPKYQSRKAVT
ncbi:MAG: kynureninase [Pseudomonadota bacterium]